MAKTSRSLAKTVPHQVGEVVLIRKRKGSTVKGIQTIKSARSDAPVVKASCSQEMPVHLRAEEAEPIPKGRAEGGGPKTVLTKADHPHEKTVKKIPPHEGSPAQEAHQSPTLLGVAKSRPAAASLHVAEAKVSIKEATADQGSRSLNREPKNNARRKTQRRQFVAKMD